MAKYFITFNQIPMKRLRWCIVVFLCGSGFAQAQQAPTSFRVKSGEDALRVIPDQYKYRYPTFQNGKVAYMNGSFSAAAFNYNLLLGEMQFIDQKGDTLSMIGEPTLHAVLIGENTYLYNQENDFLEVVADYNTLKLGKQQTLEVAGTEKEGAYNQSSGASSIRNKSTYSGSNGQGFKLVQKGDVVFSNNVYYFLIDKRNQFYKVNKANLVKMFPKHRKAISAYIKEHSLDMNNEEDLKKLLHFGTALDM